MEPNDGKIKEKKPLTMEEVEKLVGLNVQQICNLLPDSTFTRRKIVGLEKDRKFYKAQQDMYRTYKSSMEDEVKYLEIKARKVVAEKIIYTEIDKEVALTKQVITQTFDFLNIKKEDNGTKQAINKYLKVQLPGLYKHLGIPLPESNTNFPPPKKDPKNKTDK